MWRYKENKQTNKHTHKETNKQPHNQPTNQPTNQPKKTYYAGKVNDGHLPVINSHKVC
jgi:hypothetical protein